MTKADLRRLAGEALGTGLLLAGVVGSGIMGDRLSGGNAAIALLANSLATGAILFVLITILGPVSGAHLNPLVTFADALGRRRSWRQAGAVALAQVTGALLGVVAAQVMFELPALELSQRVRSSFPQLASEFVATFGLLLVVAGCRGERAPMAAGAVAAYITAAYWFTASTSFANPAVTLARAFTDTFAGIRLADVPGFVVAQFAGAGAAVAVGAWLFDRAPPEPAP